MNVRSYSSLSALLSGALLWLAPFAAAQQPTPDHTTVPPAAHPGAAMLFAAPPAPEAAPGELLVGLRSGATKPPGMGQTFGGAGVVSGAQPVLNAYRLRLAPGLSLNNALTRLRQRADVAYAEPNYVLHSDSATNDPLLSQQYALKITKADQAWAAWHPQAQVVVAIVDTGVQTTHPDLTNQLYRDGGQIVGWDFVNGDADPSDDNGHGTHCAGIAAAQSGNGVGIAGVAGGNGSLTPVKIMPVKALDAKGAGLTSTIADGITWSADHGARVISLSLGGPSRSETLNRAVQYALGKGCVVVAAAGNSGSAERFYPAGFDGVLSVAATNAADQLAAFSNWGDWVRVAAPGVSILSTLPGGNYGTYSGTSLACPFVAGEAALLLSHAPLLTNTDVSGLIAGHVDAIAPTATAPGDPPHTIATGRVNVLDALSAIEIASEPAQLLSVNLTPNRIRGGNYTTGRLLLSAPAPQGCVVQLSSDHPEAVTIPASVTVPAGANYALFSVAAGNVAGDTSVVLTARWGDTRKSAALSITSAWKGFRVDPGSITGGGTAYAALELAEPAPFGGVSFALASDNSAASVPASVRVPYGARTVSVPVTTTGVATTKTVTLTAIFNGIVKTAALNVTPLQLSRLVVRPGVVIGGGTTQGQILLDGAAPRGGLTVQLGSDNGAATVPASVTIAAGSRTASFPIHTTVVPNETHVVLTVTLENGSSKTAGLIVKPQSRR